MAAHTLQLDLPDPEQPSIWPWIVALISAAGLVLSVSHQLGSIPESLQRQAREVLAGQSLDNIQVHAEGRDLILSGTVSISEDREPTVNQLASINGVRAVHDRLIIVDPVKQAQEQAETFRQALAALDTSRVAFEPGSVSFTSGSEIALQQLLQLLRGNPNLRIRVAGHTDNTGRPAINLRLSRERAQAVAAYLKARGVASEQIIAQGYGATQPIADNATEKGRARNRRIEVTYVD